MRTGLFAGGAICALLTTLGSLPANAAPPTYNWSGFYLGANAGWGWRSSFSPPGSDYYKSLGVVSYDASSPSSLHNGFTFGVGFGYNYQFGWLVVGTDYEFQHAKLGNSPNTNPRYFGIPATKSTTQCDIYGNCTVITTGTTLAYSALNYDTSDGDSNRWFGVFRLRIGAAFDRALIYGTGGAAYRLSYDYTDPTVVNSTTGAITYLSGYNQSNAWGWVVGGGVEYAVTDSIAAKIEYLHMDFGSATYIDPVASTATGTNVIYSVARNVDMVRVGLNFKINIAAIGSYGSSH
jgi:outer membrane immunogenic protein